MDGGDDQIAALEAEIKHLKAIIAAQKQTIIALKSQINGVNRYDARRQYQDNADYLPYSDYEER